MKIGRTSNFSLRNKPLQLQKCNTDTVKKLTMGIRAIYRFYRKPRRPGIPSTQRHGVSENLPVFTSFCHQKKASVSTKDKFLFPQKTSFCGDSLQKTEAIATPANPCEKDGPMLHRSCWIFHQKDSS